MDSQKEYGSKEHKVQNNAFVSNSSFEALTFEDEFRN